MNISQIIISQIHLRLVDEGISRIHTCLSLLSDEDIYHRHNEHTNSVGHLILHLNGNVRQWLLPLLTDLEYSRNRSLEFDPSFQPSRKYLLNILAELKSDILSISTVDSIPLHTVVSIQGFEESVLGAIIHVIEHFSYHTGQITTLTKVLKNTDTGYYKNQDLNIT